MEKATLTEEENVLWEQTFADAMNNGKTEEEADAEAWLVLQESFSRLKTFEGCV